MIPVTEICQRCGSTDLSLKDLDSGRSPFSQILKCNACGVETLIPRRNETPRVQMPDMLEEPVKKDWRVLA